VAAEQEIHERLTHFRVNRRREFFAIPLDEAIKVVKAVVEEYRQRELIELQAEHQRREAARSRARLISESAIGGAVDSQSRPPVPTEIIVTGVIPKGHGSPQNDGNVSPPRPVRITTRIVRRPDNLGHERTVDLHDPRLYQTIWQRSPVTVMVIFFAILFAALIVFCLISSLLPHEMATKKHGSVNQSNSVSWVGEIQEGHTWNFHM
jgi:hypothetical protein